MIKKDYLDKKLSDLTVKEAFDIFIIGFIKMISFLLIIGTLLFLFINYITEDYSFNNFDLEIKDPIDTYIDYNENLNRIYC